MPKHRNSNRLRILVASDLHGSNACFVKLLALSQEVSAAAVCVAGDFSGKYGYLLCKSNGHWLQRGRKFFSSVGQRSSEEWKTIKVRDIEPLRREWGDSGVYSILVDDTDVSDEMLEELLVQAKRRRLIQWLEYSKSILKPLGVPMLVIPGNDDVEEVASALDIDGWSVNLDGVFFDFMGYEFAGLGYSNKTPWKTARELTEEEISGRLEELKSRAKDLRRSIFLVHVPPLGSSLDRAPEIFNHKDGGFEIVPGTHIEVGSSALRDFVLRANPLAVVSGHCHQSPGIRRVGDSVCVNPGSSYQNGVLKALLLVFEASKLVGFQAFLR